MVEIVAATKFAIRSSLRASSIIIIAVIIIAIVARKTTTLVLPLRLVTTISGTGILDAINSAVNKVDVISDDNFYASSLSKKGIADDIVITALVAVDLAKLVVDTVVLA